MKNKGSQSVPEHSITINNPHPSDNYGTVPHPCLWDGLISEFPFSKPDGWLNNLTGLPINWSLFSRRLPSFPMWRVLLTINRLTIQVLVDQSSASNHGHSLLWTVVSSCWNFRPGHAKHKTCTKPVAYQKPSNYCHWQTANLRAELLLALPVKHAFTRQKAIAWNSLSSD